MADNVLVTPGVGASIATDDVGGVQYQKVKLDVGGDGLSEPVSKDLGLPLGGGAASFAPFYGPRSDGERVANIDPAGQVAVRAAVLTDEGTFRCNFANSALFISLGTATFTNGSAAVACSLSVGDDIHAGDYVKLSTDAETAWAQVASVDSLTGLTLEDPYTGAGGTGTLTRALMRPSTGSGATISVASGQCTIASGTTSGSVTTLCRNVDYPPLVARQRLSISQRVANQQICIGLGEDTSAPRWYARFTADGTTNTTIKCQTARNPTGAPSAAETEEYTVTLPAGVTTASLNDYRIELLTESVRFYINDFRVSTHKLVIPAQHDEMQIGVYVENTGVPSGSTSVVIDHVAGKNHNKLEIGVMSESEQILTPSVPAERVASYSVAGVIAINTVLATFDASQYRAYCIQTTSMGTTGVITVQHSNTPSTGVWNAIGIYPVGGGALATTHNAAGSWVFAGLGGTVRVILTTATTAGTTTFTVRGLHQVPFFLTNNTTVSGTVTVSTTTNIISTSQGASTFHRVANVANITTGAPTSVKASAGTINQGAVNNNSGAAVWVHFYNKASAPTLGTDTPVFSLLCPTGASTPIDGGAYGKRFATGIAYAIVDNCATIPTVGSTITIAGTANAITVTFSYA